MNDITIRVPGEPVSQPRCRATSFGGKSRMYTPTKNGVHAYKAAIRILAAQQMSGPPLAGPVQVDCTFVFSRPKSHFKSGKRSNELRGDAPFWHTNRNDRDNLDKACLDAMTGIVYVDDKQVCAGEIVKRYPVDNELPGATIRIHPLELNGWEGIFEEKQ